MSSESVGEMLSRSLGAGYRVESMIGEGATSFVFRVREFSLERDVVAKVMKTDVADLARAAEFRSEAKVLARLEHPHIVPVYAWRIVDGRPVLLMRLMAGGSLADRLCVESVLPWKDAARIASETLDALAYMHDRRVVHRDIKPENLLFDALGNTMISDLGIACVLPPGLKGGRLSVAQGTLGFMSPEQLSCDTPSPMFDTYAMGILLYRVLTGHLPFRHRDVEAMVEEQLGVGAPRINSCCVPDRLAAIVEKALHPDATQRFWHASDMRREIDALNDYSSESAVARLPRYRASGLLASLSASLGLKK